MVIYNNNSKVNYFLLGPQQEADRKGITELTQQLHREFKDVFMELGVLIAHSH